MEAVGHSTELTVNTSTLKSKCLILERRQLSGDTRVEPICEKHAASSRLHPRPTLLPTFPLLHIMEKTLSP